MALDTILTLGLYYFDQFANRLIHHFNAEYTLFWLLACVALIFFMVVSCAFLSVVIPSCLSSKNKMQTATLSLVITLLMLGVIVIYFIFFSNNEYPFGYRCPFLYAIFINLKNHTLFFSVAMLMGGSSGFYIAFKKSTTVINKQANQKISL
ncbi:hypothetical protein [Pseudomonas fluorescens]|uniref:hypothetical protein n=1 Tax=Pseudomonas fluorescens TaxID=294 RepID=UPI00123EDD8E|nr:hypothetical protein [Pseudomonas fluorescens]